MNVRGLLNLGVKCLFYSTLTIMMYTFKILTKAFHYMSIGCNLAHAKTASYVNETIN